MAAAIEAPWSDAGGRRSGLLTDVGPTGEPRWVEIPVDGRQVRLQVLDLGGQPVLVMTEGGNLNWYAEAVAAADAVIASISFEEAR